LGFDNRPPARTGGVVLILLLSSLACFPVNLLRIATKSFGPVLPLLSEGVSRLQIKHSFSSSRA